MDDGIPCTGKPWRNPCECAQLLGEACFYSKNVSGKGVDENAEVR